MQAVQAGKVKKKKNRVKGKHAKGPDGTPLCGVEAKKAHFSKSPSCAGCVAALKAAASTPKPAAGSSKPDGKRKPKEPKAPLAVTKCPVCAASIPEHRLDRHMRKIHSAKGRQPS